MPKKTKKVWRSRKNKKRSGAGHTEVAHFHAAFVETATTGVFPTVSCNPATLSTRAGNIADNFDEYRLTRLRFRLFPQTTAVTNLAAYAYFPGVTTTVPALGVQVFDNPTVCVLGHTTVGPSQWRSVPKDLLRGLQAWYKVAATVSAVDSVPGQLLGASIQASTDSIVIEVDGTFEFRGEVNPTNTPEIQELLDRVRELRVADEMKKQQHEAVKLLEYVPSNLDRNSERLALLAAASRRFSERRQVPTPQ